MGLTAVLYLSEPILDFDFDLLTKDYYNSISYGTSLIDKYNSQYEIETYNISFPSEDEISNHVQNVSTMHRINVATGTFIGSRNNFSLPQTALYHTTIAQVAKKAQDDLAQKPVTIKWSKMPKEHMSAYRDLLKPIEYTESDKKRYRKYLQWELNDAGEIVIDSKGLPIPRYERVQDESGRYGEIKHPFNVPQSFEMVYRNYIYTDNRRNQTIGYGHYVTKDEKNTGKIVINAKYSVPIRAGLSDLDIERLLEYDIEQKMEEVQLFLGPIRWNWLIENHPSWAIILTEKCFNGGKYGVRGWPRLLFYMGMTDISSILTEKERTTLIPSAKADLLDARLTYNLKKLQNWNFDLSKAPFFPQLNNPEFELRYEMTLNKGGNFNTRNDAMLYTFLLRYGPIYDENTKNGGKLTK